MPRSPEKSGKSPARDASGGRNKKKDQSPGAEGSPSRLRSQQGSIRRGGVSSEAVTEDDIAKFEKKVYPKSSEEKSALNKALNSNILFKYMDESTRTDVFDCMEPKVFKAGENIITQGEDGDYFYIIHKGNVDVFVNKKKVSSLSSGGYFGELALIYGTPRSATCTVQKGQEVTTFRLDRESYRMLLMGNFLRKRRRYEEWLRKINFLESLDSWELLTLADALQPVSFPDGTTVVRQGEEGDDFFIISSGEAKVYQKKQESDKGETHVDTLKAGQYFGEVAIILQRPRAATIKAKGKLECVKIDRETFERILGPCQEIMRRNMDNYKSLIDFYSQ